MTPLKDVISALRAKKSLGQNFLTDPSILSKIVRSAGPLEGRTVIEIGPGPGGLTREIIKHPCQELILIEQDKRTTPYLEELREYFQGRFTILETDAVKVSLDTLGSAPRKIIANLPYNISVPLLLQMLQHIECFESLTLMFQKEVADRLTALPNTKDYGRLSVMCQWTANVKKLFDLPPGAFIPAPKVTSTVVQLTPRINKEDVVWEDLEMITKAAFNQRRKMLRVALKSIISSPQGVLEDSGVDPQRRAESLSISEFCTLTTLWKKDVKIK